MLRKGDIIAAIAFDTHKIHNGLISSGFSEQQADALMKTIGDIDTTHLITNADLRTELEKLELRMTIKLGALIVGGVGFLAIIKFFG